MSRRGAVRAAGVALAAVLALGGCTDDAREGKGQDVQVAREVGQTVTSPDGDYVATFVAGEPDGGVETLVAVVRDAGGDEVFRSRTQYGARQGVGAAWQADGHVLWLLSSDVGTSHVQDVDGTWTQTFLTPATRDDVPPEIDALR